MKIEAQDGKHLGIDFFGIWDGFGKQVGMENRAKIEEKVHRKYDAKPERPRTRLGTALVAFWLPKKIFGDFLELSGRFIFALKINFVFDSVFCCYETPQDSSQTL